MNTVFFVDGLIVVGNGNIFERGTILVEGERIVRVSEREIPIPKSARRIELNGCSLLPGFIDCHVHLCHDGSSDPYATLRNDPAPMTEIRAIQHARSTLNGGITSVRDLGGRDGITLALRDAIRSGLIPGPRIRASDSMVCMTGGTGWLSWGKEVDGPIEVIKLVRQLIKSGVDVVKFMATGGVMTPGVEPGNEQLTEDELKAGIGEAHKAGKKTAAHVEGVEGALNAIRAGSDSIEHGIALSEEAVSLMGERNIFLVPTLSALHNIEVHGTEGGIPSFAVDKCHKIIPLHTESLRMAHEAGIRVAMGTDAGTPFNAHGSNLAELKLLVDAGFSPMDAIESSTRIASEVLGMEEELGTIEEGKLADLVMVEGNPLEQIDILLKPEAIRLVMQGGRIVKEVVKTQV